MRRPAVFLDRDGVINRAVIRDGIRCPPLSLQDLVILPRVSEALDALKARGYALVVVTNQPDVARGTSSRRAVDLIHAKLQEELSLDAILTCFHDTADGCDCRKPKPGLLLRAARDLSINLAASFMVGDRWRDIEAGQRAGCRTFFIDEGYEESQETICDFRVGSLHQAAGIVLALSESS
jgi:D-glycero-D-manno-heptose 1,7-bisphosphate phosphatase